MAVLSDRMTEQRYKEPIRSFAVATHRAPTWHVDVLGGGRTELEQANQELGMGGGALSTRTNGGGWVSWESGLGGWTWGAGYGGGVGSG